MVKHQPSELYYRCLEEARAHHASSKTYSGKFLRPHAPAIKQMIEELGGVASILDYGAGKGLQYDWVSHGGEDQSIPEGHTLETYWGAPVTKYDPAWPPYATEPTGQFDLVLCTHALGSIPIVDLAWILERLFAFARKGVYIAEKIGPVGKQVFSNPGAMPRWSASQWAQRITSARDDYARANGRAPLVKFATREKIEVRGVVCEIRKI